MELRDYLRVLRKRYLSILILAALGLGLAVAMTATTPRSYTASAQSFVAISTSDENRGNIGVLQSAEFAQARVKSYTLVVTSPEVLQPVVSELDLPYSAAALAGSVNATNPAQTVLLEVTATDGNPQTAAAIANAVAVQLGRVIESIETPTSQSVAPVKVSLIQPASVPTSPSAPKRTVNYALGLMLGLAAGLAWAFVRETLDTTVKTGSELDKIAEAPSLGSVLFDVNAKSQVLSALDATAIQSEGYRTIRANLQYINVDDPVRAFVVTSAAPGDGKTTVACNLAIALAQANKRVCLVESDLRRPRVTEYLQMNAAVGLTEVLAGQVPLMDAMQSWGGGMLHVLPPGSIPPNPSELLGSQQMAQLIAKLKDQFDVVILDAPPLLAVSDAAVLASQSDGAIVVVRHGKTSRDAVRHAIASLEQVNVNILGTVLNTVPAKRRGGYGYGYGYGYGEDSKSSKNESVAAVTLGTAATGSKSPDLP